MVTLEPIQINLAGGHYLRIGIALQLTATPTRPTAARRSTPTIDLFSGADAWPSWSRPEQRAGAARDELEEELEHGYHGDVMEVYFTEFVTQ